MESWVLESGPRWSTIRSRLRSDHRNRSRAARMEDRRNGPTRPCMHARLTVNRWIVSPAAAGPSQAWRLADRAGVRRRLLTGHKSPAHQGPTPPTCPPPRPHFTAATPHWPGESLGSCLGLGFNLQFPPSPGRPCVRHLCLTLFVGSSSDTSLVSGHRASPRCSGLSQPNGPSQRRGAS